jgi:PEP-CTERM motif
MDSDLCNITKAFIEKGGTFRLFAVPGAMSTSFFGLNDNGIAVGDYVNSLGETNGLVFNTVLDTFITLNDPHAVFESGGTTLNGINDQGQIVGFYGDAVGNTDGLLAIPTAIPEPATWGMMLLGFTGLGFAAAALRSRRSS